MMPISAASSVSAVPLNSADVLAAAVTIDDASSSFPSFDPIATTAQPTTLRIESSFSPTSTPAGTAPTSPAVDEVTVVSAPGLQSSPLVTSSDIASAAPLTVQMNAIVDASPSPLLGAIAPSPPPLADADQGHELHRALSFSSSSSPSFIPSPTSSQPTSPLRNDATRIRRTMGSSNDEDDGRIGLGAFIPSAAPRDIAIAAMSTGVHLRGVGSGIGLSSFSSEDGADPDGGDDLSLDVEIADVDDHSHHHHHHDSPSSILRQIRILQSLFSFTL